MAAGSAGHRHGLSPPLPSQRRKGPCPHPTPHEMPHCLEHWPGWWRERMAETLLGLQPLGDRLRPGALLGWTTGDLAWGLSFPGDQETRDHTQLCTAPHTLLHPSREDWAQVLSSRQPHEALWDPTLSPLGPESPLASPHGDILRRQRPGSCKHPTQPTRMWPAHVAPEGPAAGRGSRPGAQRTRAPAKREASPTPWAALQRVPLAWPLHHSRDHYLPCACRGCVREGVFVSEASLLHAPPPP